jgi:hypothetical protein
MNAQNAVIYSDTPKYGDKNLNYRDFISKSYIMLLTLETLLHWTELLNIQRN